jgi:large subunit ribosomal protein L7/L12
LEDINIMDIAKLIEEIKGMTVLELNELVKAIETEFGVSAAAMAVAAPAAGGAAAPAAEEKTEFDINLKEAGPNKIPVIKVVKAATGLGLGEAKALVDGAPKVIKQAVPKAEAEDILKQLTEAGATAELI